MSMRKHGWVAKRGCVCVCVGFIALALAFWLTGMPLNESHSIRRLPPTFLRFRSYPPLSLGFHLPHRFVRFPPAIFRAFLPISLPIFSCCLFRVKLSTGDVFFFSFDLLKVSIFALPACVGGDFWIENCWVVGRKLFVYAHMSWVGGSGTCRGLLCYTGAATPAGAPAPAPAPPAAASSRSPSTDPASRARLVSCWQPPPNCQLKCATSGWETPSGSIFPPILVSTRLFFAFFFVLVNFEPIIAVWQRGLSAGQTKWFELCLPPFPVGGALTFVFAKGKRERERESKSASPL